ncbi:MAG: SRPBCC family protein [Chloroflexi bacterium]|nr:SRPBCC family protein [Chloroflexota bacterium]
MSVQIKVPQVIDRPVEKVFHFYADEHVRNHPRWDPDMHLEQVSDGPIGVGTVIRRRNTHSGTPVDGTMKVVEFEPNKAFGVLINDGLSVTHGRVTFETVNEKQTTLTIHADFPDMDESMKSRITGLVERSARTIKQLIEAEVKE